MTTTKSLIATKSLSTKELSALYDRIYDIADRLFKKYNPCNIHIKDNKVCCTSKSHTKYRQKHLCCNNSGVCNYWSDGCTIKCLPCKLFACDCIYYSYNKNGMHTRNKKYKQFTDKLKRLIKFAQKQGIHTSAYFNTKNNVLKISKQRKSWS